MRQFLPLSLLLACTLLVSAGCGRHVALCGCNNDSRGAAPGELAAADFQRSQHVDVQHDIEATAAQREQKIQVYRLNEEGKPQPGRLAAPMT